MTYWTKMGVIQSGIPRFSPHLPCLTQTSKLKKLGFTNNRAAVSSLRPMHAHDLETAR